MMDLEAADTELTRYEVQFNSNILVVLWKLCISILAIKESGVIGKLFNIKH